MGGGASKEVSSSHTKSNNVKSSNVKAGSKAPIAETGWSMQSGLYAKTEEYLQPVVLGGESGKLGNASFSERATHSMKFATAKGAYSLRGGGGADISSSVRHHSVCTLEDIEHHRTVQNEKILEKYKAIVEKAHERLQPWTSAETDVSRTRARGAVSAQKNVATSCEFPIFIKEAETAVLLKAALTSSVLLFGSVSEKDVDNCVAAMEPRTLQCGERIIQQGEFESTFYVISSGSCDVLILKDGENEEQKVAKVKRGGGVGELALMYDRARTATVAAAEDGMEVYSLSRTVYRQICFSNGTKSDTANFLKSSPLFLWLRESEIAGVGELFEEIGVYAHRPLCMNPDELCYFVSGTNRGNFSYCSESQQNIRAIENIFKMHAAKEGCFSFSSAGALEAAKKSQANNEITLTEYCPDDPFVEDKDFTVLRVKLSEFLRYSLRLFEYDIQVLEDEKSWLLDKVENMTSGVVHLSVETQEKFYMSAARKKFPQGWKLTEEDQDKVVAVISGSISRNGSSARKVMAGHFVIPSSVKGSLICDSYVNALVFAREDAEVLGTLLHNKLCDQAENVFQSGTNIDDLVLGKVIGEGAFGTVRKVTARERPDGGEFALKAINMDEVSDAGHEEHIRNEVDIMGTCAHHPFLTRLHVTFDDGPFLYLLLDLNSGGEMFSYMVQRNRLQEAETVFYSGCIFSAINHLHKFRVAYRDLKPENVTFDARGFPKVVDFGFAKYISEKTYTLCGTPDYLAPEIITSEGHTEDVDYWALGVLIYEMLAGYTPFNEKNTCRNDEIIYRNILKGSIDFGLRFFSPAARSLVRQLCSRDPFQRSGWLTGTTKDIQNHPFYKSFDWSQIGQGPNKTGNLAPPYTPSDGNNFATVPGWEHED